MSNLLIKAYLKPWCGWSNGVRAIMKKHNLQYEDIDIINNPDKYEEMVRKSGQPLSPCVEVNGTMLADISGEEVEAWMIKQGLITPNNEPTVVPTDRGCADHEPAPSPSPLKINFKK